jgi:FtsP/CotA-like multicopper oxidase with cupredoxin domain
MKKKFLTMAHTLSFLAAVFLVSTGIAWQAEAAVTGPTSITIKHACISMPDGAVSAAVGTVCPAGTIKMWLPADSAAVLPATGLLVPGSFVIEAAAGDNLTITLRNELAIPVSLTIPGQVLSDNTGPVWFADIANPYTSATASGSRPTPTVPADPEDAAYKYRVRSFSHETPAGVPGLPGAPTPYTWNNLKAGTYLILSGTHPSLQVQMGIYGVLIVRAGGGAPYPGTGAPAQEATLLFSEIDTVIHNAADDAAMLAVPPVIPVTNDFKPSYFLINGKAFPGNNPIPIGNAGSTTLLRFANAGLDTYVPLLQDQSMEVIAEDGYLKPAVLRPGNGSLNRYSVDLHAGKTFDALLTNPTAGYIPLYDRRLYLSNAAKAPGGMMAYLEVGGPGPNTLTVATNGGTGTGTVAAETLPGGIYCNSAVVGSDCTQDYLAGTELKLVGHPDPGASLTPPPGGWTGCDSVTAANECLVTMTTAKNVIAAFVGGAVGGGITLTSPNGGEVFQRGGTATVTWSYTGTPGTRVRIQAIQGTRVKTFVRRALIGSNGLGSVTKRIPSSYAMSGNDIKLKVFVLKNTTVTDTSDNFFTINP